MAKVLIVDDEANLRKVLAGLLRREAHTTATVAGGAEALLWLAQHPVDLVLTDLKMPGMDGLALLAAIQRSFAGLPVLLMTAHGSVDTAVSALKMGAFDYITKPFDRDELKRAVRKAASLGYASRLQSLASSDAPGQFGIIGQSPRMASLYQAVQKLAASPSTVLISGESGTGKELVAAALHKHGPRRDKPFIKVNCAAIPEDLMESEFFGHAQGAFTGAVAAKPGRFELADGGTLFLDEIAELPLHMQAKLLRVLQESEFERVGGVRSIRVDVRVVAATNRDLLQLLEQGRFREDLYYRLRVVPLAVPPLRERHDDIALLVPYFIDKLNKRLHKEVGPPGAEAMAVLSAYPYPGNIRELENMLERAVVFAEGSHITLQDLPEELFGTATARPSSQQPLSFRDEVRRQTNELERGLIARALENTQGNVTQAALQLQMSRKGLQNKMKDLGLREQPNEGDRP